MYDLFCGRYNLIYDAEPITKFCKITQQKVLKTIYPKTHQIEFVFLYVYFFSLTLELDSFYFLRKPNLNLTLPASGEFSSLMIAFAGSKQFDTLTADLK